MVARVGVTTIGHVSEGDTETRTTGAWASPLGGDTGVCSHGDKLVRPIGFIGRRSKIWQ
jgi:hypothetical protein